ncbi:hypothetical protein BKG82_13235 [Mycobacteroides chelonae]|uniref:HTH gntR-type domain-containing protein n=2 Tax=Mycobacteroides TaxID=670516 RepID=A0A1S1LQS3_MYCCH|nr:hypothetical protein AOT87_09995 [Mycobacteroides sp. H003]KRQ37461.1 hypothetical protein AOT91_00885 [Mycobacteroides sp. H092]KRQ44988.1 hypothetical protein AOT92_03445 [Mycobacteroides sp. H101]KRQ47916.1 hypothetical protein AOT88_14940 [Mycobacteroides sp. H063]KRQ62438.1 hypothetical protein AOT94_02700 [Mycobacteroides sp. HXVII]KRQ67235.1 hypothetical protein AOT90_03500 [Mycobacteroides sp. H079]KRQ82384.1 hypothetical protein AOT93_09420 [Mycobacteroides sp. H110]KRQ83184.1 hy
MLELGQIDRAEDTPPYRQIAYILRRAIASDQLRPGDQLPSEAKLIAHFGVARMTVRQAIQELRSEGLVVSEHGRGVFVRSMPPIRERWPQEPGLPAGADMPDFNRWGDAAPLILHSETLRTRMYILDGDIREVESVGDPAVVNSIVRNLAGVALAQADVLGGLAMRLRTDLLAADQVADVLDAFEAARRTSAEACRAWQAAAKALRQSFPANSDPSTVHTQDAPSQRVDD